MRFSFKYRSLYSEFSVNLREQYSIVIIIMAAFVENFLASSVPNRRRNRFRYNFHCIDVLKRQIIVHRYDWFNEKEKNAFKKRRIGFILGVNKNRISPVSFQTIFRSIQIIKTTQYMCVIAFSELFNLKNKYRNIYGA